MKEKGGFPNQEGKESLSNSKCFDVSVLLEFHLCLIMSGFLNMFAMVKTGLCPITESLNRN